MKKKEEVHAFDVLPVPIRHTNLLFSFLFLTFILFLIHRWRKKICLSIPLHVRDLAELIPIVFLVGSLIYLPSFFGIALVQTIVDDEDTNINNIVKKEEKKVEDDDENIIASVVVGSVPSYSLESRLLGDCRCTAGIRCEALKRITDRKVRGLPLDGFDYDSILGQFYEMSIGYAQLPVGIAGLLTLDGRAYYVPMATTEGCLVASTNMGCKAIANSVKHSFVILVP